jgi:hypothetical protein
VAESRWEIKTTGAQEIKIGTDQNMGSTFYGVFKSARIHHHEEFVPDCKPKRCFLGPAWWWTTLPPATWEAEIENCRSRPPWRES